MGTYQESVDSLGVQKNDLRPRPPEGAQTSRWWTLPDTQLHEGLEPILRRLESQQAPRRANWLRYARLYTRRDIVGFGPWQAAKTQPTVKRATLSLNVVKSCIDAAASKIAKARPRAMFLTSGADYRLRESAKMATKYVAGLMEAQDAYETGQRVFVDSVVFGTGVAKLYADGTDIKIERCFIGEILVDDEDGREGDPSQVHQIKPRTREWLLALVGADEAARKAIEDAPTVQCGGTFGVIEYVMVRESWRRPTRKGGNDGRHCWTISGATLMAERWEHDWLPFVFLRWTPDLFSFHGIGLAEELFELQIEIAKTMRHIARAIEGAVPRVLVDGAASISKAAITDEIWSILTYTGGNPPTFSPAAALSPEVYQYLEGLIRKAYEITGISQMSAQSKKPAGDLSGVALRTLQDVESERFALAGQRLETFYMDVARLDLDLTKELAKTHNKLPIKVRDGKNVEQLDFLDLDLDEDRFLLDTYPVSQLPTDPAGRLQFVSELMKQGVVSSREEALELLDWPDTEEFINVYAAGLRSVQRSIQRILNDGVYVPPSKAMPLQLGVVLAQAALLEGEDQGRPERNLTLLQQWIDAADATLDAMQPAPAMAPSPPPAGGPPGTSPSPGPMPPVGAPMADAMPPIAPMAA